MAKEMVVLLRRPGECPATFQCLRITVRTQCHLSPPSQFYSQTLGVVSRRRRDITAHNISILHIELPGGISSKGWARPQYLARDGEDHSYVAGRNDK